jgi:amino acid transporter
LSQLGQISRPKSATEPGRLPRLSTTWVFFLVISAASPVTSLLGAVPLGFINGNGPGLPAAFAVVTVVLICFAVGYAAISRRVINTGAYYTYIAQGIGRPPAIGAALLAVAAYTVNLAGITAASGYFLHIIADQLGANVSWIWGAVPMLLLVGFVGYRSVHVSAKVIGTIMVLGFLALFMYDVAILTSKGLDALPLKSFTPEAMFSGSPGLAIAIALTCFVGVDTAALYSEETDDPERTVPRATYIAVVAMGLFYVLSVWLVVGSGPHQAKTAQSDLIFDDVLAVGGEGLQTAAALLFLAASFAGILAFHNAASRYLFVLGRDRVLSPKLGHLHRRHRSPFRASLIVSGGAGLLILVAIAFRLDPYVVLAQGALGLATLGIVTLQALAAVAIVAFFRRRGQGRYLRTLILPGIGAVGLFATATFILFNFDDLLGIHSTLVNGLPWLIVLLLVVGVVLGLYLRAAKPARYARLAESRLRPQARQLARPEAWTRRYCLIGAGPAGLVMGRRLYEEGVPFDWFEAGSDVGGIWHADRPGSPIYETLAAATSRVPRFSDAGLTTDYPSGGRSATIFVAREFYGLYDRIRFRTAVLGQARGCWLVGDDEW